MIFEAVASGKIGKVLQHAHSTDLTASKVVPLEDMGKQIMVEVTPLTLACWLGHADIAKLLLAIDASLVNVSNTQTMGPLVAACARRHARVLSVLLAVEVLDVNTMGKAPNRALTSTTDQGWVEGLTLLLTRPDLDVNVVDQHGRTALSIAAAHNSTPLMEALLSRQDILVNLPDKLGCPPLLLALSDGNLEAAALLLEHPSLDINAQSANGTTALHEAVRAKADDMVDTILALPSVNANPVDSKGVTPLMCAAYRNTIPIARRLLSYPDVVAAINKPSKSGMTALMIACEERSEDMVNLFLALPNIDVNVHAEGQTALSHAVLKGSTALVEILFRHPNIEPSLSYTGENHRSAFFKACQYGYIDIVKLFLARPDAKLHLDREESPLSAAASHGHLNVVELLLQTRQFPVNQASLKYRDTALHGAIAFKKNRPNSLKIVELLLQQPDLDINAANSVGHTALHVAAKMGRDDLLTLLLAHPAHSINLQDKEGCTALRLACQFKHVGAATILVKIADIDVNMPCQRGNTPLIAATDAGSPDIVRMLLGHPNIQVNARNENLETALLVAATYSGSTMACLLDHPDIDKTVQNRRLQTAVQLAMEAKLFTFAAILIAHGAPFDVMHQSNLMVMWLATYLQTASSTPLLLQDLPVSIKNNAVTHPSHNYSWTTFLDSSTPVKLDVRLETVQAIVHHADFAAHRAALVRELALATDVNGRTALQITDAATRAFLNEQLFFCSRYELFDGPPIHVSSTAVVVNAFDFGIFKQVFDMHATDGHVDKAAFAACSQALGHTTGGSKKASMAQSEFDVWDKNKSGALSEVEFLRHCDQAYGGKLKVALKFMRNANEHAREIDMRRGLIDDQCVLALLPTAPQTVVQAQVSQLTLHNDLHMATYPNMLVMPAADRSLEDIYLKERPNDNQIRSMLQEVAEMLQRLHANDVVHGDVKKLNMLRVDNHMRLIDMDAATPMHEAIGAKFSSGSLPPEMFYKLKSDDEVAQYTAYWQQHVQENPELWAKVQPRHHWVVKSFHGHKDSAASLPYALEKATPAIDVWAFGVLMYQMYSGVELVPTDRNQDVDDSSIERAATWTKDELASRIQNKVTNPLARDLILKLLAVDPNDRIGVKAMLGHEYFDVKFDKGLQTIEAKLDKLHDQVASGFQTMHDRFDQVVELTQDTLKQLGKAKEDLMRGIFQATEVRVPTSFVLLPFNVLEKMAEDDDAEAALEETASFIHKGIEMGTKFMKAVKSSKGIGSVLKLVSPGEPLYLYLIDEVVGAPVVPPLESNSVYPIKIETKSDEYVAFMATAMPYIQTGFKLLKGVNTVASMAKALGVPSMDKEVLDGVEDKIDQAQKTSTVFDFGVLQEAVEKHDTGAPVHRIRGAALRELERFFDTNDQDKDFAGLGRTYSASGQVLWTTKASIEAFEKSKRPDTVDVQAVSDKSGKKKGAMTAQEIYAQLLQAPVETERKIRTPGAVAIVRSG